MPIGKWKGVPVSRVPFDYLDWFVRNAKPRFYGIKRACEQELRRRQQVQESQRLQAELAKRLRDIPGDQPRQEGVLSVSETIEVIANVVRRWKGEMLKKYHPDRGGSDAEVRAILDAVHALAAALKPAGVQV